MTKTTLISKSLPAPVRQTLLRLGRNIHIARLRRNLRLEDLAQRVGISRFLMSDIEKGKPTAAISAYVGALWALGLLESLRDAGNPDHDVVGETMENARTPKKATKHKRALDNDF